ncbi:MAG: hypothetical protein ACYDHP_00045 [Ferrimicrobium sp.]
MDVEISAFTIEPWNDPLALESGYPVQSRYVELFWLPLLGPSSLILLRRLDQLLSAGSDSVTISTQELARSLGLGASSCHRSLLTKTIARCSDFHVLRNPDPETLSVRRRLHPLSDRQLTRLPAGLRELHLGSHGIDRYRMLAETNGRLLQLTATLRHLGAEPTEIIQQLVHLGYDRQAIETTLTNTPADHCPPSTTPFISSVATAQRS